MYTWQSVQCYIHIMNGSRDTEVVPSLDSGVHLPQTEVVSTDHCLLLARHLNSLYLIFPVCKIEEIIILVFRVIIRSEPQGMVCGHKLVNIIDDNND